jgi:hypothetical protein
MLARKKVCSIRAALLRAVWLRACSAIATLRCSARRRAARYERCSVTAVL